MKRCILLALVLTALILAACGGDVKVLGTENSDGQQNGAGTSFSPEGAVDGYLFQTSGLTIAADAAMQPILEALGEPKQYYEAASCAFNGLDKMYTYDHFEVDSYPAPDGDRVMAVYLLDDLVATPEGLRVGDSTEKAKQLYGAAQETVGTEWIYEKGGMKLKVLFENGAVASITYASQTLGKAAV